MSIQSLLDSLPSVSVEDRFLLQLRVDHLDVALLIESHYNLPNVDLGNFTVEQDLLDYRLDVFVEALVGGLSPLQTLSHIIS